MSRAGCKTDTKKEIRVSDQIENLCIFMIPFLILLGFFLKLYFPDSLISIEVFYLPKQQEVKIVVVCAECVSFLTMIQW